MTNADIPPTSKKKKKTQKKSSIENKVSASFRNENG